jgi:hypothetical protein
MKKYVLVWEIAGIIIVFLMGSLLHFLFGWSGNTVAVGVVAPVNESVWEHFKLGFWPLLLFSSVEYWFVRSRVNNFITAKAVDVWVIPLVTGLLFYGYTAVLGKHILVVDILIFLVAIIIGQLISYRILVSPQLKQYTKYISMVFILMLGFLMIFFTFYPPHLPIFLDEIGFYGIP